MPVLPLVGAVRPWQGVFFVVVKPDVQRAAFRRFVGETVFDMDLTLLAEVDSLHARGVDAVVGMAIYTGRLALG